MGSEMFVKLELVEKRFNHLNELMSRPEVVSNQREFQRYAQEHSEISGIVDAFRRYKKILKEIEENTEILKDEEADIRELAEQELSELKQKRDKIEDDLKLLLIPKDPRDEKNIILEIRAGTGGDEAALFASDLFRMYSRYAEKEGWRVEVLSSHLTGKGGFKEIVASIKGKGVFSKLKYESGTHRVQRIPETEASGRIHTSAVTVAILPEAEEVEVDIDPSDIKIDVFRSSGPGGQSVNTTDSAVRITHIPTGIIVSCQDEKSQHKNRARGMSILRARLLDKMEREQHKERAEERKIQVGTGDRSERIRTYNFPQGRVTDHRIGLTLYKLDLILGGEIDELIENLILYDQAEALKGEDLHLKDSKHMELETQKVI